MVNLLNNITELLLGILFILGSTILFCNALEHFGAKIGISEGVTGSIFVAVGTALPETIVPLIALCTNQSNQIKASEEIGIGAILGPPLMLSTLSIALMALSVINKRSLNGSITPEKSGLKRDLYFFLFGYSLAILLAFSHNYFNSSIIDIFVVMILAVSYFVYVLLTIHASSPRVKEGHITKTHDRLYLSYIFKVPNNLPTILIQVAISLSGLVYFANIFIEGIISISHLFGLSAFLISLVLIPVATELPEKINSILWIRKRKDTLAFANITGAMVFQGLLLPILGILLTEWKLGKEESISCITTFGAVIWLLCHAKHNNYKVKHFVLNGCLYFLSLIISTMVL